MTSDTSRPREAFVWIWLSGKTAPVIAGRVYAEYDHFVFTYGRSYLDRDDAIPIYAPELPLRRGVIVPETPLEIANALRDASPDAWPIFNILQKRSFKNKYLENCMALQTSNLSPYFNKLTESSVTTTSFQKLLYYNLLKLKEKIFR